MDDAITRTTLFDTERLRVDLIRQPPARHNGLLACSFTERGANAMASDGFAGAFLLGLGFDVLALKSAPFNWFQAVPEAAFEAIAAGIAGFGRRYTARVGYGSSMGAYGAIRHSRALGLDRVLALSPLFDIRVPWDNRYHSDTGAVGDGPMMDRAFIAAGCRYFFVYDSTHLDARHVANYREIIEADRLVEKQTRYSGHPSGFFLNEVGALKAIASGVLLFGVMPDRGALKVDRNLSGWYLHTLALVCQRQKKHRWTVSLCGRALLAHPGNVAILNTQATSYLCLGMKAAAEAAARQALALEPGNPHRKFGLAYILAEAGKDGEALAILDETIPLVPNSTFWEALRARLRQTGV